MVDNSSNSQRSSVTTQKSDFPAIQVAQRTLNIIQRALQVRGITTHTMQLQVQQGNSYNTSMTTLKQHATQSLKYKSHNFPSVNHFIHTRLTRIKCQQMIKISLVESKGCWKSLLVRRPAENTHLSSRCRWRSHAGLQSLVPPPSAGEDLSSYSVLSSGRLLWSVYGGVGGQKPTFFFFF